jgi:hypothetical protein
LSLAIGSRATHHFSADSSISSPVSTGIVANCFVGGSSSLSVGVISTPVISMTPQRGTSEPVAFRAYAHV